MFPRSRDWPTDVRLDAMRRNEAWKQTAEGGKGAKRKLEFLCVGVEGIAGI